MDTQKIDWTQPLEAVHTDGRVVSVELAQPDPDYQGHYQLDEYLEGGNGGYFNPDGTPYTRSLGWTIRNVAPKEVEWGPEIKVEGKRPEWLEPETEIMMFDSACSPEGFWYGGDQGGTIFYAHEIRRHETKIRLKANHPHYSTPTRTALEQRMHSLIKHAAVNASGYTQEEARAILAELEPVDPLIQQARNIVADAYEAGNNGAEQHRKSWAGFCRDGSYDGELAVKCTLTALRGRALERGE